MQYQTRITMLALALFLVGGCGGSDGTPSHRDGGLFDAADHVSAADALATEAGLPLPDALLARDSGGSGFDQAQDRSASDAGVDAGITVDSREDTASDLTVEAAPADAAPVLDAGCALLDNLPKGLPSITFTEYHTLAQMLSYLQAVAAAAPQLGQYQVLGKSKQGRDLGTLVINATCLPNPPAVFYNGAHHGDENASAEAVLALPDYLLRRGPGDASVRALLQSHAFYFLPVVNPDGFTSDTRANADGDDINRDYPFPGRNETNSFKTGEALLIKGLQESVGFAGAVAFHSGAEEVLWPWCYTGAGTDDESFFLGAGKRTAAAMGFTIYQQSYDDYPTQGEYIDYAYAKSRTLAATFEVSNNKRPSPSALAGAVERACQGAVAWAQAVSDRALGRLHSLPAGPRPRFPFTAPFDGRNRLE